VIGVAGCSVGFTHDRGVNAWHCRSFAKHENPYHPGCIVNFISSLDAENISDNGSCISPHIIGLFMVLVKFTTGQYDVSGSGYRRAFKWFSFHYSGRYIYWIYSFSYFSFLKLVATVRIEFSTLCDGVSRCTKCRFRAHICLCMD
jgi:hypothetical protein